MASANVPRNLQYDQTSQSTLAETLIHKQAPEGRTSQFNPGEKIDFRFPTSGGFVDSFASSTLDFDLDITGSSATTAWFDPYLGAHQLIDRLVVTVGGNILEDTTNYPLVVKMMTGLHGNEDRLQIDMPLSDDASGQITNSYNGDRMAYWSTHKGTVQGSTTVDGTAVTTYAVAGDITANKKRRFKVRLNLMSCLGSLSCAKYWPSALLDSDIRLEIYLNQVLRGMTLNHSDSMWQLNNVEFTMTRVRLNTRIIESLKSSAAAGGVKMIMPGFSHFQETLTTDSTAGGVKAHITKYSSSASSLKSILVSFRDSTSVSAKNGNSYNLVDPIGLEYQFLIGSTLMPARPVITTQDKYRELMRCMGGPINSLGQRNLLNKEAYCRPPYSVDTPSTVPVACHIIGQSLEMYADHTLSSTVFSGINAINLTMQCQMRVTSAEQETNLEDAYDNNTAPNLVSTLGAHINSATEAYIGSNVGKTFYVDSILVFDRLLNFNGSEVTMGY